MLKRKTKDGTDGLRLQAAAAAAIFGLAAWGAYNRQLMGWEEDLFLRLYEFFRPANDLFYILTQAGSAAAVIAVGLAFFLRKKHYFALKIYFNAALAYAAITAIKHIIVRPRPGLILDNISQYDPLASGYGFPSGHTAVAAAMALTIWPIIPKPYRPLILIWPLAVGLSRITLGVHAPLDIAGGFAIGWLVVALTRLELGGKVKRFVKKT